MNADRSTRRCATSSPTTQASPLCRSPWTPPRRSWELSVQPAPLVASQIKLAAGGAASDAGTVRRDLRRSPDLATTPALQSCDPEFGPAEPDRRRATDRTTWQSGSYSPESEEGLARQPDLLMSLQRNGVVTITVPLSGLRTEGLMPIGITHARLCELATLREQVGHGERRGAPRPDAQLRDGNGDCRPRPVRHFDGHRGTRCTHHPDARRSRPNPGHLVVVLDAEDRGLGGLRHLPHVADTLDDEDVVAQLEALTSGTLPQLPVLVLAQ